MSTATVPTPTPTAARLSAPGWVPLFLALAAYIGYDQYRSRPAPPYMPVLATAAVHSKSSFSPDLSAIAEKCRHGTIGTKAELVAALADHSRAFMSAIDELCQVDTASGKITNLSAVADSFDQAAKATK